MSATAAKRKLQPTVAKAPVRPTRSIGLWVDHELLRKHLSPKRPGFFLPEEGVFAVNNRYLELADTALKHTEKTRTRDLVEFKKKTA